MQDRVIEMHCEYIAFLLDGIHAYSYRVAVEILYCIYTVLYIALQLF